MTDNNISVLRSKLGLSQSQLAELSGVSVRSLQSYEQGKRSFSGASLDVAIRIADALRCDVRSLLSEPALRSIADTTRGNP